MIPRDYTLSPHTFEPAEYCPAARCYRGPKEGPSQANWHGIAIHRFLQYAQERGRGAALAYIAKKFKRLLPFCEEIDLKQIPEGMAEPQYLIDTKRRQAVLLEAHDNLRAEADWREHVTVRGDLLSHDGKLPWVIDFKSGKENTTMPDTSAQSMIEALAAYLHEPNSVGVKASVFNIVRGEIRQRHHTFTVGEVEAIADRVRRVHLLTIETRAERREGLEPGFVLGEHCRWCSARNVCPEKAAEDARAAQPT